MQKKHIENYLREIQPTVDIQTEAIWFNGEKYGSKSNSKTLKELGVAIVEYGAKQDGYEIVADTSGNCDIEWYLSEYLLAALNPYDHLSCTFSEWLEEDGYTLGIGELQKLALIVAKSKTIDEWEALCNDEDECLKKILFKEFEDRGYAALYKK